MDTSSIVIIVAALVGLYLFIKLIKFPIKLLLHAAGGFILLLVAEFICGFFDFSLGINFLKCVAAGVLGIPGVIIIVALRIFTGI